MSRDIELQVMATIVGYIRGDIETHTGGALVTAMTRLVDIEL